MKVEKHNDYYTLEKDGVVWPIEVAVALDLAYTILAMDQAEKDTLGFLPRTQEEEALDFLPTSSEAFGVSGVLSKEEWERGGVL